MLVKYGKAAADVMDIKKNFLEENGRFLEYQNKISAIYQKQKRRRLCKCCMTPLEGKTFVSHDMNYTLCHVCGHLNGEFEETEEFSKQVYEETEYDCFYIDRDRGRYDARVEKIYTPKLNFLLETLGEDAVRSGKILDVGAGSGYFCRACRQKGVNAQGIEISGRQVEYARLMTGTDAVREVEADESMEIIRKTDCNIVTMFGVMESVFNLQEIMGAIKENEAIRYVYFNVPMFSLSVILEAIHPESFNRNLGGAHTHLFSNDSVRWLMDQYHMDITAKWRFGSDMMDMQRFISNQLVMMKNIHLNEIFAAEFQKMIDDLQMVLDRHEFSSETHFIAKKREGEVRG